MAKTSSSSKEDRKQRHRNNNTNNDNNGDKFNSIIKGFAWSLLLNFFVICHIVKDKLLTILLEWYLTTSSDIRRNQRCPKINDQHSFLLKSGIELGQMIRQRKITSSELVSAYIERINEINPIINAIMDGPFKDEALREAKIIDERIRNGQISLQEFSERIYLGVPFSTKDSTQVKNGLHTLGLVARKTVRATEDAECIRLMRKAGGIMIATTSVPEVNKWQETRNNLIGQTNNPYDTRRTVGGSSGGEAALISACGTAFGIGTDIGGSIRMPAFYCGIFGHKPTVSLINTKGCTFRTGEEESTMVVVGPMARYADDLMAIFKILVGPENCLTLKLDTPVNLKKLKYYYIRSNDELRCSPVSNELQTAMTRVTEHFRNISEFDVEERKLYGTNYTSKMWRYWMTQEPANFNLLLGNGKRLNPLIELAKKLCGQSNLTLAAIYSLIDEMLPKENAHKIREITTKCYAEITEILNDNGIIFYHNTVNTAPFHYMPLVNIYNFSYWCIFNVLQVPATQVPLGLDSKGLPLGIQIVSGKNRDGDCLAVAKEIETAFKGWVAPF